MREIKICGLFRPCDIEYVNLAKPDYIGFILNFPKSHRNISLDQASRLKQGLDEGIKTVGVFVNADLDVMADAVKRIPLDVVQLHGKEGNEDILALKQQVDIPVWKAFKIRCEEDLEAARDSMADRVLLDSGTGTGKVFDWSLISGFDRPFILAGGLKPEMIEEAFKTGAMMVDLSSGVESEKVKDKEKIMAAVFAARKEV